MTPLESNKRADMRHLPRLTCVLASFCALGAMFPALAQSEGGQDKALAIDLPALTELKIVQSSRTDVPDSITVETAEIPSEPTRILDEQGAERLMRNEGVTLQWISWDKRGDVWVGGTETGHWSLLGGQGDGAGAAMDLEGFITEIGADYFVFQGTIKIFDTPNGGRTCRDTKQWRFAVTQNRSYYRLREFEWCDGLTDYIDIYFPPSLR